MVGSGKLFSSVVCVSMFCGGVGVLLVGRYSVWLCGCCIVVSIVLVRFFICSWLNISLGCIMCCVLFCVSCISVLCLWLYRVGRWNIVEVMLCVCVNVCYCCLVCNCWMVVLLFVLV